MLRNSIALISSLLFLAAPSPIRARSQRSTSVAPPALQSRYEDSGGDSAGSRRSPALQRRNTRYQLHSADVLELSFPFAPEFNQTVTVQPDGYITPRNLDGIRVQGQTIPEVTKLLEAAYTGILHDPVVTVEVRDFEKPSFIVGGEVGHPGKFDLLRETTVTEAMAIAGGLKDSAKHSRVLLFRREPDGWVYAKNLNLKQMLRKGDLNEDVYLQADDFIYVPKSTFSKIERFIPTSSMGMYTNPTLH